MNQFYDKNINRKLPTSAQAPAKLGLVSLRIFVKTFVSQNKEEEKIHLTILKVDMIYITDCFRRSVTSKGYGDPFSMQSKTYPA